MAKKAEQYIKEWNKKVGQKPPDIINFDFIMFTEFVLQSKVKKIKKEQLKEWKSYKTQNALNNTRAFDYWLELFWKKYLKK